LDPVWILWWRAISLRRKYAAAALAVAFVWQSAECRIRQPYPEQVQDLFINEEGPWRRNPKNFSVFFQKPCKNGEPFALWLMMSGNSFTEDVAVKFAGGRHGNERFPGNWNRE
jgi:hypothetical protein